MDVCYIRFWFCRKTETNCCSVKHLYFVWEAESLKTQQEHLLYMLVSLISWSELWEVWHDVCVDFESELSSSYGCVGSFWCWLNCTVSSRKRCCLTCPHSHQWVALNIICSKSSIPILFTQWVVTFVCICSLRGLTLLLQRIFFFWCVTPVWVPLLCRWICIALYKILLFVWEVVPKLLTCGQVFHKIC